MDIEFHQAKNKEQTVSINNIFLHSNYNPSKEAERFVDTFLFTFKPHYLVLIEPGLPYTLPYFRNRFPKAKIGVIRYLKDLSQFNYLYDFTIDLTDSISNLDNKIFKILDEEKLLLTQFLTWTPIAKLFSENDIQIWKIIKNSIEKAKTLLITREYFEKKWLLNTINFIKYTKNTITINNTVNKPVLLISSGPSLKPLLPIIKENHEKFFIICLSSAISVCINNHIIPDLCISTDGGYWAGQHLKSLHKYKIPLAISSEAYCPKKLLQKLNILPLDYGDGISHKLLQNANITTINARRNGTVSGTALELALSISKETIYFAGLDLSSQTGYQHSQPNELEINNSLSDNLICSKEKRIKRSEFSSTALNYYLQWFQEFNPCNRKVYRIIDKKNKNNSLNFITDIQTADFQLILKNITDSTQADYFTKASKVTISQKYINFIQNELSSDEVIKQLFPLKNILLEHDNNNPETKKTIQENFNKLLLQINGILND